MDTFGTFKGGFTKAQKFDSKTELGECLSKSRAQRSPWKGWQCTAMHCQVEEMAAGSPHLHRVLCDLCGSVVVGRGTSLEDVEVPRV